jgi:hypothetical protein
MSRARVASHPVHLCHTLNHQWSLGCRERNHKGWQNVKQQFPVYFTSEILIGSKKYYSEVEKICYAVIMSARKLQHYFEAHTIKVLTNQPLNDIFDNRDNFGRNTNWAMELSEYVVDFEKRSTIK